MTAERDTPPPAPSNPHPACRASSPSSPTRERGDVHAATCPGAGPVVTNGYGASRKRWRRLLRPLHKAIQHHLPPRLIEIHRQLVPVHGRDRPRPELLV